MIWKTDNHHKASYLLFLFVEISSCLQYFCFKLNGGKKISWDKLIDYAVKSSRLCFFFLLALISEVILILSIYVTVSSKIDSKRLHDSLEDIFITLDLKLSFLYL